ncbi:MAG TPA: tail fiber domain-containing protein [Acidobacteriota bacterium]|nr:tail fiber domain-containing protein [Acidobacteriota bacterium]
MNLRRIALISFLACLLGGFVCAQGARPSLGQPGDLVELELSPDIAAWDIKVPNDGIALRVTGPRAFVYQATYASGDPVFFDFVDESGAPLADGVYNWEVVVTPSGALRAKREEGAARQQIPAYSGTFRIEGGLAVSPDINEQGLRPRDIIHNDDVIATFSLCVGTDCVNGESFGFDTIRLKENNLRIKFQDTSNSASFPTQDWQLTANDSANGGANKFSIDAISPISNTPFTIEAGAPSHSLYVDDGGRIGAGTSTPVVELHVVDGDTPTLRLEQNGSSGFAPQTWDVAGNETNFFVRDATNGSTLPFKIRPSAPNNVLVIDPDGDIGMGVLSPTERLHMTGSDGNTKFLVEETNSTTSGRQMMELRNNGGVNFILVDTSSGGDDWQILAETATGTPGLSFSLQGSGNREFRVAPNGDVFVNGSMVHSSSRTVKEGFVHLDPVDVLSRVNGLPLTEWNYIKDGDGIRHIGPMAEDFYEAFGLGVGDNYIAVGDSAGVALAAIQGLSKVVEEKDQQINELNVRIKRLERLIEQQ